MLIGPLWCLLQWRSLLRPTGKCYPHVQGIIINTENEYPLNATGPYIVYERDQRRGRLHNGCRRYTRMHARTKLNRMNV